MKVSEVIFDIKKLIFLAQADSSKTELMFYAATRQENSSKK